MKAQLIQNAIYCQLTNTLYSQTVKMQVQEENKGNRRKLSVLQNFALLLFTYFYLTCLW